MAAGDLFTMFGGAGAGVVGVCLVFCVLFITGQVSTKKQLEDREAETGRMRAERDEWKHIAELERTRADSAVVTGQIVRDVMTSLRKELG